jgi:hypothetical protein
MKVLITTKAAGTVDYTRYVVAGSITIEDSLNVPTLVNFTLSPVDSLFVIPKRSSYVQIVSEIYGVNSGYGSGKILATGFITTEPERDFLGVSHNAGNVQNAQYNYKIQVTSDEWLLNSQAVSYIPAFVNQTDSQILGAIAEALNPGFLDVTSLAASGTLVPFYQYDPAQTWSDIAKTFADANRYHYKVINKQFIYQPFGDKPLGIAYNEQTQKQSQISPFDMSTGLVTVPPVNDCIVIGDVEPQTNCVDYFVGDGFTSNFQLKHQVFQGTSDVLLQDDWTESTFAQGTWIVNDPANVISLADANGNALGALNIVQKGSPLAVYVPQVDATFVQAQNGLELGGGINLQHGSVTFNDTASGGGGIIGGIYGVSGFTPGNCLAGFGITGQTGIGAFTVVSVTIPNGNSNLVQLTVNGVAPIILQPGYVMSCAGFGAASFLNGTQQTVVGVQQNTGSYVITAQGSFTYASPYGPTTDSGTITFGSNAVFVTASGAAGIVIQPIYNGQFVGQPVVTQANHQYLLQTWIGAGAPTRYTRPYTNMIQTATYGNQNLTASGSITWVITDVNLGVYVIEEQNPLFGLFPSAPPPVVTKYTQYNASLPPFALYCLLNGIDLNVSINYTLLSLPPQGYLTVQSLTGASGGNLPWLPSQLSPAIVYQLGEGQDNQTAQVSQQGEAYALAFYTDDIPSVGARIAFQSWAAGQSVSRVQDPIAIANEASITGDNGIRSAIMNNLNPLPRTSAECEAAAGAAILDREYPQFQGTYTVDTIPYKFESLFSPSMYNYPMTGRFLYINAPTRGITGQNFSCNTVRVQILEMKQEVLSISVDYGPDLYLEKLLPAFLERDQNVLTPTQTVAPPNPITLAQVLNYYLPTLDNAVVTSVVNSASGNYISVSLGTLPITGCEVRSVDSGWGIADQGRVGFFTTSTFTLPRTVRDQTWYLRAVNGPFVSRFSKKLRVAYPLIPSAPALVSFNPTDIVLDFAGDVRDIYGLEVRAVAGTGSLTNFFIELPDTNPVYNVTTFARTNQGYLPGFNTPMADFSCTEFVLNRTVVGPSVYNVGDVVLISCYADSSFNGFKIITAVGTVPNSNGITFGSTSSPGVYSTEESYLLPFPDTIVGTATGPLSVLGQSTAYLTVGTAQLVQSGATAGYVQAASGSFANGIATFKTQTAHNLTVGQLVVIGAAFVEINFNPYPAGFAYVPANGSFFCGTWQVAQVIDGLTFTFTIPNALLPGGGLATGVGYSIPFSCTNVPLNGLVAGISTNIAFSAFIQDAPPGTLIQKTVTAPADLVIDLTQSDLADALSILEAANGGSRIAGLAVYFFNLTWDYSQPTIIPSFNVPAITGLTVIPVYQGISWGLSQGTPTGHRVETLDLVSGVTYSKYTIDHPNNPQVLLQANLPVSDYLNARIIKVTPFDALGDGIPSFTVWAGASGGISGGANPGAYTIGSTYNGSIPASGVMVRIPLDQVIQFYNSFVPSQAYLEIAPASGFTFSIYQRLKGTVTDTAVGLITFPAGSNVGFFTSNFLTKIIFNVGDLVKVVAQGTADPLAANFGMTLSGTKYYGT